MIATLTLAAAAATLGHPASGIVVDREGRIAFVDFVRSRVLRADPSGTVTTLFSDRKRLPTPHHLALDRAGELWSVGDQGGRLGRIAPDGTWTPVAVVEDLGAGGDPFTLGADGTVWFGAGDRLKKRAPDGTVTEVARGFLGLHGATLLLAPDGALFLTDAYSRVCRVAPDGKWTVLAGARESGHADGRGMNARFHGAAGLALDRAGHLFVAEFENRRIRRVAPDGTVSTFAGTGKSGGADGPAAEATFEEAAGLAFGTEGAR
jgi:sugar lactone lactonase YvrE